MNRRPVHATVPFVVVAAGAFVYLLGSALLYQRDLSPHLHDEHSYLIQAHMLARGRLWMPPLPDGLGDFFESFHLLVKPVYASIYFPGTALLYVPGVWLGIGPWVTSLLICATVASAMFALVDRLLGRRYAWLAALMFIATPQVRMNSTSILSHLPAMLAGVLIVLLWIRWRESKSLTAVGLLGAALGWAAIVRPYDLLAYAVPVGAFVLIELFRPTTCHPERSEGSPVSGRRRSFAALRMTRVSATLAVMVTAAAPFACLQLVLNHATTGEWLTTPYRSYVDQFQPGSTLGFPPVPERSPDTKLPQKIDLYYQWARPQLEAHRPANVFHQLVGERLPLVGPATLTSKLLLILIPFGIWAAVRDRRLLVIALVPFLFLALYALNPYFIGYYPIVICPAVIVLVLAGCKQLARVAPQTKLVERSLILVVGVRSLFALPEVRFDYRPEQNDIADLARAVNAEIEQRVTAPAVILFRYAPGPLFHFEPVYNDDVAWPLDASVIRAHDLGPERNAKLFDYLAQHDPARDVWLLDRHNYELAHLGRVDELRARAPR